MPAEQIIAKRFTELEAQMNSISQIGSGHPSYDTAVVKQWATSAQHIIRTTFGEDSPHYKNFTTAHDQYKGFRGDVEPLKGIFRAAKSDYDGGYLFSLQATISGEIYGDFVLLAKAALTEGSKDVAGVLACAALEDALKRFASLKGLDASGKDMQQVVNALKSKGFVGGAQRTLLDTMPKIRDYAMHANWEKLTPLDVGSVIGFVEQLLLTKFS